MNFGSEIVCEKANNSPPQGNPRMNTSQNMLSGSQSYLNNQGVGSPGPENQFNQWQNNPQVHSLGEEDMVKNGEKW